MPATTFLPATPIGIAVANNCVDASYTLGIETLTRRSLQQRKAQGQYFTPPTIAHYMAQLAGDLPPKAMILDPAVGSGVLASAVIERYIEEKQPSNIFLVGYEVDTELLQIAQGVLQQAQTQAKEYNIQLTLDLHTGNFFKAFNTLFQKQRFDVIIANPPYFKISPSSAFDAKTLSRIGRHTNIYTAFLMASALLLNEGGKGIFIVPRSFFSGLYFDNFRKRLLEITRISHIHVFESRSEIFKPDSVLQENVIIVFQKGYDKRYVLISSSFGTKDIQKAQALAREVPYYRVIYPRKEHVFFRTPTNELDDLIIQSFDNWEGSLEDYGLAISTGPVVPFRSQDSLCPETEVRNGKAVPLYWLSNIHPYRIEWPIKKNKPQGIYKHATNLLVPTNNYVFLRRFSSKEDPRRLVAAPFLKDEYSHQWVGIENHVNYIYKRQGSLTTQEVWGLTAFLNSIFVDRFFRSLSGNTQVNATEIRSLPLPPLKVLRAIGKSVLLAAPNEREEIVYQILKGFNLLIEDIPFVKEMRLTMIQKIQEAQMILEALGLPKKQRNELAALTLLALAQMNESTDWAQAKRQSMRVHDILIAIKNDFGRVYAENTRETIRRQVIHYFMQRGIVEKNPDDPSLPTNSPRTHYALTEEVLAVIQSFHTEDWEELAQKFLERQGEIIRRYQAVHEQHRIPLQLPNGETFSLSPGAHNKLQVLVINEFGPRFAPGSQVLYIGDTEDKLLHFEKDILKNLGVEITEHDKLPDIVLYNPYEDKLFLIEVVTSHGPVSQKRLIELEDMFGSTSAKRIYISAFPDFREFSRHLRNIAWDTEVWISAHPEHLIHFNGDKFFHAY